jgi:hypothetical protein
MTDYVFPNLLDTFSNQLVQKNVGIVEFCESDEFCDKPMYPRQRVLLKLMFLEELDGYEEDVLSEWIEESERGSEIQISPKIRERQAWLRENDYPHFGLVQLVGGRGSGKGFMTGAAIAYKVYQITRITDPKAKYNMEPNKDIYFSIFADSLDQAKAFQFKDARNWLLDCTPLVNEGLMGSPLAESIAIATRHDLARIASLPDADKNQLASLRVRAFPKNAGTIRGQRSIVAVIDEMAHIMGGESQISDVELYNAIRPAMNTFGKDALMFANSSPWTKQGMFYEIFRRSVGDKALDGERVAFPTHFTLQYPSWEIYKDWERDRRFNGAVLLPPDLDLGVALEEKQDPDRFRIEYRAQFGEVIDAFLAPEIVDRMFDPVNQIEVLGRKLNTEPGARFAHLRYKGHGDPSSTNANFGIAIGHMEMIEEVDPYTGQTIDVPHVVFDFVNAFFPEDFKKESTDSKGMIDWLTVLPTLEEIINSFRPESFTFDQYESDAAIQILNDRLRARGLTPIVGEVKATVPHNRKRALNFKQALYLNRVHAPHPHNQPNERALDLVRKELKFLVDKSGKVDKQTTGPVQTKDIADCIMEVVDQMIGDMLGTPDFDDAMSYTGQAGGFGGYSPGYTSRGTPFEDYYSGLHRGSGKTLDPARGLHRRY